MIHGAVGNRIQLLLVHGIDVQAFKGHQFGFNLLRSACDIQVTVGRRLYRPSMRLRPRQWKAYSNQKRATMDGGMAELLVGGRPSGRRPP